MYGLPLRDAKIVHKKRIAGEDGENGGPYVTSVRENFRESLLAEVGGYHLVAFRPSTCGPFLRGLSPLTYTLPLDQTLIDITISPLGRFALLARSLRWLRCQRQG